MYDNYLRINKLKTKKNIKIKLNKLTNSFKNK
jgi:hypothetical protein